MCVSKAAEAFQVLHPRVGPWPLPTSTHKLGSVQQDAFLIEICGSKLYLNVVDFLNAFEIETSMTVSDDDLHHRCIICAVKSIY